MNYSEDENERIAIIREGCHLSETEARLRYKAQVEVSEFGSEAVKRLKQAIFDRKLRKEHKLTGKDLASGKF